MIALLLACSGGDKAATDSVPVTDDTAEETDAWGDISIDTDDNPPDLLSDLGLMRWDGSAISYHDEVVPYALNTALFSDFSLKDRAVWMPAGTEATYTDAGAVDFPVGTVILKSFLYADDLRSPTENVRIIETRVLMRGTEGWTAWPYLWQADGSDADLHVSGDVQTIDFIDPYGTPRTANYLIPQRNQCVDCHDQYDDEGERFLLPIGPQARTLPAETLARLTTAATPSGTTSAVDWDAIEANGVDSLSKSEVVAAARDYLDMNCAHCHSPRGIEGITSQFFLNHDNEDEFNLGICKRPGSAGEGGEDREFDIVPGDPKQSILWYRTATEDVGAMMPDIGRSLTHDVGAALVWRWIAEMEPDDCEGE